MADRFPSLDEFSGGQTEPVNAGKGGDDPEDFLARERAALGDDADQFVSPNDRIHPRATVAEDDDDLLGGGDYEQHGQQELDLESSEVTAGFESSFPAIQTQNEQVGPGGTITGIDTFFQYSLSTIGQQQPEEDTELIREWRAKRDAELSRRAEASTERKAATVKKAQQDIDDFYEAYNKRADKGKERTRAEAEEFLANRQDTSAGGTSWERIAKLVDVSGKGVKGGASGSGKERFRELLLDLKKDQNAPGATGI